MLKIFFPFVVLVLLLVSCKEQEARRPIQKGKSTFMKESVARNIKIVGFEEGIIDSLMKQQKQYKFFESQKGFWFAVTVPNENEHYYPQKNDVIIYNYEIQDLFGTVIYSKERLKTQNYLVDKQNIMMGMRYGLKKLKKGETGLFYFPSHMAFGYHGDNRDIPPNMPLKVIVEIIDIKPENKF